MKRPITRHWYSASTRSDTEGIQEAHKRCLHELIGVLGLVFEVDSVTVVPLGSGVFQTVILGHKDRPLTDEEMISWRAARTPKRRKSAT